MKLTSVSKIKKTITCTETTVAGSQCKHKAGWHAQFKGLAKIVDKYMCRKHYEILAARELPGLLQESKDKPIQPPAFSEAENKAFDEMFSHLPDRIKGLGVMQKLHDKLIGDS